MNPFTLEQPRDSVSAGFAAVDPSSAFIAGGTTVIDLWKLGAFPVTKLVDINALNLRGIQAGPGQLKLGALDKMNAVGEHADVKANWPVVSQSLLQAASPQIRNMGTMGGNLLQRPRSITYRNPDPHRHDGPSRFDAIFGTTSWSRSPHPSDLAVALMALDAAVTVQVPTKEVGMRTLPLSQFYHVPDHGLKFDTLSNGELITAITANVPFAHRSAYIKIRDRASYQFAVVSAAVVLDLDGDNVREARIAAGGVGTIPWRFTQVEAALKGKPATPESFNTAIAGMGDGAVTHAQNSFKVELVKRTTLRALLAARALV